MTTDKTSTAPVMSLQQARELLDAYSFGPVHSGSVYGISDKEYANFAHTMMCAMPDVVKAIDVQLDAPTPDVVGGFSEADVARCEIAMVKASAPDTGTDLEFNKACVRAILEEFTRCRVADVVGGDVVAFRFVRADGHKYTWVDASEMDRNGRPEDVLAEGERIEYAYAAPRVQGDADHSVDLRQELKDMVRAYVRLLEVGRDRIVDLGGSCDPLDVMEQGDPNLIRAKRVLAAQPKGNVSHPAEQTRGDGVDIAKQIRGSIIRRLDAFHESNPSSWCGYLDDALGAAEVIAANLGASVAPRQAVPDGWQLVPIEPTEEMIRNAWGSDTSTSDGNVKRVYAAMLAAAPSAGRMGVE